MPTSQDPQVIGTQLRAAIAAQESLRATLGDAAVDATIAALREKLAALEPEPPAEQRKLVTILFTDIVGSTRMSEQLDPEDVLEIMDGGLRALAQAVQEHGGMVGRFMGDGMLAFFGVPSAREDDPERAIQAGLAIVQVAKDYAQEVKRRWGIDNFDVRVGINTGLVVMGEVGSTEKADYTAMGDAVNLAARMESAAPVGGILISHATYRHVRGVFDVLVQEPIRVKGKAEPIQTYVVQRAKPRASLWGKGMRGVEGIEIRMIGRDAELKRLQDAFYEALDPAGGERQMVTVVGEAGVGKSRLLHEFDVWSDLQPETFYYFKGRASQEMRNLPYALLRDVFSFRFQIQDTDPVEVVREKVEQGISAGLGAGIENHMKAHFIGQLLGFDFSASSYLQGVLGDAQQLRDRGLIYIGDYFEALAARQPVLILLEDLHWADDSSLDALNRLAWAMGAHGHVPLLIVCAARPSLFERRPYWGEGQAFHDRVELQPLSKRNSRRLVAEILQKVEEMPAELADLIVEGAEGNPFYVEELVKMLLEDGVIVKGEENWQVEPERMREARVPPTLMGVLQARLDGLPMEEKSVLQQASIMGRTFWDSAVEHVAAAQKETCQEIDPVLAALRDREMIFRRETSAFAEAGEYIFKHTMLREVTYESVLKRVRRVYHGLVAEWLMAQSDERQSEVTGLIADHLELAGRMGEARVYLKQAGERAAAQYANAEAVRCFSRALELTPAEDIAARYELLLARERLYDLQGVREAQAGDLVALEALAEALDDGQKRAEVALRRTYYTGITDDYPAIAAAAQTTIDLAQAVGDVETKARGYLAWGTALRLQANLEAARPQYERALALAQAARCRQVEADSLRGLGGTVEEQGDTIKAKTYYEQSLDICREIGDRRSEAATLRDLGLFHLRRADLADARVCYEQALSISREIGDRSGESVLLGCLGAAANQQGDSAGARAYSEQALRTSREVGDRRGEGVWLGAVGRILAFQGDYTEAQDHYERAWSIFQMLGDRAWEVEMLTALGNLFRLQGDYTRAREYHETALHLSSDAGYERGRGMNLYHLGLIALNTGNNKAALEYSQQALPVLTKLDLRPEQLGPLLVSSYALLGLDKVSEAAESFRQALDSLRALNLHHIALIALAGQALTCLAQQDVPQALVKVEEILTYLDSDDFQLASLEEPFGIYVICYRVLQASEDPRAQDVLYTAHGLLQERAAKISDEKMRRAFLENVATHREILSEFAERT